MHVWVRMQKLKTEKVTKEFLKHEGVPQGSYPRGMFTPLGVSDEFLFRNNFNDQKTHFIRTRKIFPHSRESFPCREIFIWQR